MEYRFAPADSLAHGYKVLCVVHAAVHTLFKGIAECGRHPFDEYTQVLGIVSGLVFLQVCHP